MRSGKRTIIGAMVAGLLAGPAVAQDRMTAQECTDSWQTLASDISQVATAIPVSVDADGWCRIEDQTIALQPRNALRAEVVRWRASDIARFVDQGLPPRSLDVDITGVSISAKTGDPVFDYLFALQASRSNLALGLSVRWDGVQNTVTVDKAYIEFDATNRVGMTARIDNIDLTNLVSMQASAGAAGLSELSATVDFDGWFETHAALALGTALLQSGDVAPEAQVESLKTMAIDFVTQLPDATMQETSKTDVIAFVSTLPQPRGQLQIDAAASPPFGAARALPFAMIGDAGSIKGALEAALDGVNIRVAWTEGPKE